MSATANFSHATKEREGSTTPEARSTYAEQISIEPPLWVICRMGVTSSVQIGQSADGACETPPLCADANKNYSKRAAGVVLLFELIVPTCLML